jgi:ABC-2 type transport system permease protein
MIVPGLVAVIMMIIAAMLTSLTIAREWERGTMEQLAATPVTRVEVVLGKLLPYVAIGLIDVVRHRGARRAGVRRAVPRQPGAAAGYADAPVPHRRARPRHLHLGGGPSQLLATQVAMVVTFLPAFLLSGFMYAIE